MVNEMDERERRFQDRVWFLKYEAGYTEQEAMKRATDEATARGVIFFTEPCQ